MTKDEQNVTRQPLGSKEADLSLPIGFEDKTLDDAKRMAIAFADSVG